MLRQLESAAVGKYTAGSGSDIGPTEDGEYRINPAGESASYGSIAELRRSIHISLAFAALGAILTVVGVSSYLSLVAGSYAVFPLISPVWIIGVGVILLTTFGILSWKRASRLGDIVYLEKRRLKKKEQN